MRGEMEAMTDLSNNDDHDRMSLRNSLLVWVFGAVLGWVVAVVAIYTIIRTADNSHITERNSAPDAQLEQIAPAAGESHRALPHQSNDDWRMLSDDN